MDQRALDDLLNTQSGVVSRHQVLDCGGGDNDIARLLRRRVWAVVHRGVYVHHTGPLTQRQREWAAVLACWPAALHAGSSLQAAASRERQDHEEPIELLVPFERRVSPPQGVRVERSRAFAEVALMHLSPPRTRIEHAALVVASRRSSNDGAVAVLADACQSRRTTAARLLDRLTAMPRLPNRRLLGEVLEDVASGAWSALERRYLRHVERAHGLPRAARQAPAQVGERAAYRDVLYRRVRTLVELDGRLGHEWTGERWDDLDRDVAAAEEQLLTIRVGWRQVLQPCRLALAVARILRARGWRGTPRPCSPACLLQDRGAFHASGRGNPPQSPAA